MMQFLNAATDVQGIHYSIWLDTTKTLPDGTPDLAYVMKKNWNLAPVDADGNCTWPGGEAAYESMTLAEVRALAQHELDKINAPQPGPTPLSVSGQTF